MCPAIHHVYADDLDDMFHWPVSKPTKNQQKYAAIARFDIPTFRRISRESRTEPTARRTRTHPFRPSPNRKIFGCSPQERSACLYSSLFLSEAAAEQWLSVGWIPDAAISSRS